MRRSQYENDSDGLNRVYQLAYERLEQRHVMDDDAKSRLVAVTLKAYFLAEIDGSADAQRISEAAVIAFDA